MSKPKKGDVGNVDTNPPESEKQELNKIKIGVAKISASYGRKVNLKSISTQFDNVDQSFFATCWITFKDPEEFKKKSEILSNAVRDITEHEIGKSVSKLMEMKKDSKNSALLGIGVNIEHEKFVLNEIGDLSELLGDGDGSIDAVIKNISDIEEVELESVEV